MLIAAITVVLFYPNGWLPVLLAGGSTLLLAFDRKLGPFGAALFVMLVLPVGRGSEIGLPRLGDIPVRPHDLAPLVGAALTLPAVARRFGSRASLRLDALLPLGAFAVVGVVALLVGVIGDQALRDIVRDARWWAFYAVGGLALLAGTPRAPLVRALVWGLTIYAAIVLIGLLMPLFHGGLKYGAYAYDPRMRLHYGQAVLLLVPIAFGVDHVIRKPSVQWLALLALLSAAIGVTLTRTLLVGALGVTVLTAVWALIAIARRAQAPARRSAGSAAAAFVLATVAVVAGIAAGFGAYQLGVQTWTPTWAYSADQGLVTNGGPSDTRPVRPALGRVFEDTENAGFGAQAGGRLASYAEAFADTGESPLIGHGMGQQATISWAWGGVRAINPGTQPGVDNAYLTVGLKAGAVGMAAFAAMFLWPIRLSGRRSLRRMQTWYIPAWLGILGLTLIQSFAVSGYAPFALSLLLVLPALSTTRRRSTSD
ncbi:MAG: O-antigen ligase family protein [Candidatus Limnocylindria bacterium]